MRERCPLFVLCSCPTSDSLSLVIRRATDDCKDAGFHGWNSLGQGSTVLLNDLGPRCCSEHLLHNDGQCNNEDVGVRELNRIRSDPFTGREGVIYLQVTLNVSRYLRNLKTSLETSLR